jgi:hypothetical protein
MRLLAAAAAGSLIISSLGGADIERALSMARARDADRQQFHQRYVFDLPGPVVTQIDVITPFRRMVIIGEDHVTRGDWMFTRGLRAAEDAIKPMRSVITLRATLRFNPMNTFIEAPPYTLAVSGPSNDSLEPVATTLTPLFSNPFKARDGKMLSSLIGATLESSFEAALLGGPRRTVAVTLERKDVGHVLIDFTRLE